ncbi:uncharacterized protein METZ01_LOCUS301067, partial [marine metagenome]
MLQETATIKKLGRDFHMNVRAAQSGLNQQDLEDIVSMVLGFVRDQ